MSAFRNQQPLEQQPHTCNHHVTTPPHSATAPQPALVWGRAWHGRACSSRCRSSLPSQTYTQRVPRHQANTKLMCWVCSATAAPPHRPAGVQTGGAAQQPSALGRAQPRSRRGFFSPATRAGWQCERRMKRQRHTRRAILDQCKDCDARQHHQGDTADPAPRAQARVQPRRDCFIEKLSVCHTQRVGALAEARPNNKYAAPQRSSGSKKPLTWNPCVVDTGPTCNQPQGSARRVTPSTPKASMCATCCPCFLAGKPAGGKQHTSREPPHMA
jgi:hypothetical protein